MTNHIETAAAGKAVRPTLAALCLLATIATLGCRRALATSTEDASTPALHVETASVTLVEAPVVLRLTGSLKGTKEADLAANAAGRVVRTFVERGDEIEDGTVVAQLDTSAAALSLAEAKVEVETSRTQEDISRADCARYEQLRAKGAISPLEYDQTTAKCKTAPLALDFARARQQIAAKNVGDGTIRAPFSGVVAQRFVEVGEYVQASSKVVSIVQSGDLRLELAVPEANVAQIRNGAEVSFTVAAYVDRVFLGTVRFVSGAVRTATRDLVVEAVVPNGEKLLRPGMFADVSLATGSARLPSVPLAAVFERQDKRRVYVVAGGRLQERVLQYGPEINGRLVVEDGVKEGEKVAIGNLAALRNGAPVE